MRRPRFAPFAAAAPATVVLAAAAAATVLVAAPAAALQGMPLAPLRGADQSVTPVFEGWYRNADGTFTLSFGYFNRNRSEVLEIEHGRSNRVEPAEFDGRQPTRFEPRRHWGVFGIVVPADFPLEEKVYWTLVVDGREYRVPGHLKTEWEIDALAGEAGSGNTPPVLAFGEVKGAGPLGVTAPGTLAARAGEPVAVSVRAWDDGRPSGSVVRTGRLDLPIRLTWFKHSGPGEVWFTEAEGEVPVSGGEMATSATFGTPGDYVLRVRANDASGVAGAGHAQCCWTNGFVHVRVTR